MDCNIFEPYSIRVKPFCDTFIFPQDETGISGGTGKSRVFAPKGYKAAPQKRSPGNSHESTTACFTVNAAGDVADVTVIYATGRNFARKKLQNLPKLGATGEWHIMNSPKGWMDRDVFLEMLKNFDQWLTQHNITRPVILFMDGHTSHYSIAICDFCDENQIKLWLLKPNSTKKLQPLDVVHYQVYKKEVSARNSTWLAKHPGMKKKFNILGTK